MYCDLETLYRVTLEKNPRCWLVHNNLGVLLVDQGHLDEAVAEYHKALEIRPDYPDVYNNLGSVSALRGQFDQALHYFQRAVEELERAGEFSPGWATAHFNLGKLLARKGKFDAGLVHFQRALALVPDYLEREQWPGLVPGDLPGRRAAKRRRGGEACRARQSPLSGHAAGPARYAGRSLCRSGTVSRSPGRRAARSCPGRPATQANLGGRLAGPDRLVPSRPAVSSDALELSSSPLETMSGGVPRGSTRSDGLRTHSRRAV